MKETRMLVKLFVACGVALAMVTSLTAQTAKEVSGKVVRIKGNARYQTVQNVWHPLKVGTLLKPGSVVQTAEGSFVDIVLDDDNAVAPKHPIGEVLTYQPDADRDVVRLFEDSILAIDKLTITPTGLDVVKETELDLRRGRIFGMVKKLSGASHYEVKIPNGVAGIRGTVYMISANGVLTVLVGTVVISWAGPDGTVHTEVVMAGYQYDLRTGLLTPLPPLTIRELWELLTQARVGPTVKPTTYTHDHTIYYISPTRGQPGGPP